MAIFNFSFPYFWGLKTSKITSLSNFKLVSNPVFFLKIAFLVCSPKVAIIPSKI
jgi:hypothetical protein